jgi:hypothetical protein
MGKNRFPDDLDQESSLVGPVVRPGTFPGFGSHSAEGAVKTPAAELAYQIH